MQISQASILQWFKNAQKIFSEKQAYLTELDRAIGDADHGLNMQRGFNKVAEKLPTVADKDIGTIFKTVGMTLLSQVGGASGPLFGTFFLKSAQTAQGKMQLSLAELYQALKAGSDGVIMRGRAELQDKTMCDVLIPVLEDFAQGLEKGEDNLVLLQSLAENAKIYAEKTIPLQAKKGRASYLNERSIGHQDPGATSVSYLLQTLVQAVEAQND